MLMSRKRPEEDGGVQSWGSAEWASEYLTTCHLDVDARLFVLTTPSYSGVGVIYSLKDAAKHSSGVIV